MEQDAGGHLRGPDFQFLLSGAHTRDDGRSQAALTAHLVQCPPCRARFELYKGQDEGWSFLKAKPQARRSEACPEEEKWILLAGGARDESESAALLNHVSDCDACGKYLKEAVEDLEPPALSEVAPALSPEFRARIAAQLRSQFAPQREQASAGAAAAEEAPITPPRRRFLIPVWAYAGAAVAALAVFLIVPRVLQPDPGELLVQAYEYDRVGAVRFPGAEFTQQTGIRSEDARNAALAEAEARILRALEKEPGNPRWLRLRGQLDFLRRRYDSAIAAIQPLTQRQDVAADVYLDLGMIYLARGLPDTNASDLEKAIEYLSRGLQKDPDNPVGIFNRALALESMFLWEQAEQDWNHYLRIDSVSGWAREAREGLERVEKKKRRGAPA